VGAGKLRPIIGVSFAVISTEDDEISGGKIGTQQIDKKLDRLDGALGV